MVLQTILKVTTMGSAHDIMQTFAEKEIRAHFKECDGWNSRQVPSPYVRDMTCILSREVRGRKETLALAVSYDEEPSTLSLEAVTASVNRKSLNGQYLIVPKAANVSVIPKTVQVISMESFGFVDDRLVWLSRKKNVKRYPQPEESVVTAVASAACDSPQHKLDEDRGRHPLVFFFPCFFCVNSWKYFLYVTLNQRRVHQ